MAQLIGKSLGRYHILEQLGEGGMAVVYKAFDTRLETEVAVKVIRTENILPKALPRTLKRFEREAKALAKLTHPNIVKVSDYGEYEGMPYLVMPYFPGGTLKAKMGKAMDWQEAIHLLLPVANALEYAHEQKLIHRDVKPANILLTEKNQPMLSDFGVAKIFDLEETVDMTGTGMGVGTPEYMAPEQWTGKTTAQSDIYALGIVLYEALTGRKPYSAETPAALLLKQANDLLPRPTQFSPKLPKAVEQVLLKALAKDPVNRYQSMGNFVLALEKLQQGETAPAKSRRERVEKKKTPKEKNATTKMSFPIRYLWFILGGVAIVSILVGWLIGGRAVEAFPTKALTNTATPLATSTPTLIPTTALSIGSTWQRPADEMTMLYVPASEFKMGSEDGGKDEKPVHAVYLDAYWVDQTEVINTMYAQCWQEKVCDIPTNDKYIRSYEYRNHPVVYISWEDASIYCEWADARLPTEAEWEKAARGNANGAYPWGSMVNETYANYHGNVGNTQPVGVYSRSQNAYGLDDMAGNVWEFTADWYSSDYYSISPTKNPIGPEQGDAPNGDRRAARGGSWGSTAEDLRVYSRHSFDPTSTGNAVGFRCARDVTQDELVGVVLAAQSTPIPMSENSLFYDDFENTTFDGNFDQSRWSTYRASLSNTTLVEQRDGILSISEEGASNGQGIILNLSDWNNNTFSLFEAKLMVEKSDMDAYITLNIESADISGGWSEFGIGVEDKEAVVHVTTGNQQITRISAEFNTWYEIQIKYDPDLYRILYFVDDKQVATYDIGHEPTTNLTPFIQYWHPENGDGAIVHIDDVIVGD